jgi:hypothetical protein
MPIGIRTVNVRVLPADRSPSQGASRGRGFNLQRHSLKRFGLETIVTKSLVLSDVAVKTAYVSFTAAAMLFVFMLLLAGLHL